jgi:hypothetical protein
MEHALEVASHITHPWTIAAFALVFAGWALIAAVRAKKPRVAWILAAAITILGLSPLVASTILQSRGIYHVRVVVLGLDHAPITDAHVSSSIGGEPKKVESGWEFDIPQQTRPADGKLVLFASVKEAFLNGSSALVLDQDYFPTAIIQLASNTTALLHGVVLDERRRSVAGATVSIEGYADSVTTDKMGNFTLPAHASEGQIVKVRAQKDRLIGSVSVPAGRDPVELLLKRP